MTRTYGDELAVIAVTYSPGKTLPAFLDSLGKATTRNVRVILADNGSTDGSVEEAEQRRDVELLRTGGNLGYGRAANRGVAELGDEFGWVIIANPDIEWGEGSIDELLAAAERWPRGGAFGPLIRDVDGSIYPSARQLPSISKGIGHAAFGKLWPDNPWTTSYKQTEAAVQERVSEWLSGACQLIRREAFDSVHGFDETYFMYFEDVDLGDRITKSGWLNVYVPSAEIVHIGGAATDQAKGKMLAVHHESAYHYIADRHQGPVWAPLRAVVKVGLDVRLKLETRKEE
jgi:N-acetylglucosaminyl-diphospho-decaprenol L-rhamnosyltransferase